MNFRTILKEELRNPLPGAEYQAKMVPEGRPSPDFTGKGRKNAAVALVLYNNHKVGCIELILIKRTEYKGHHSGQVSFPGGKVDRSDSSLLDTAVRETFEEIGIQLYPENLLGELTPLYILVSGFLVQPFVFFLPDIPQFKIDAQEVNYPIHCCIDVLLDESLIRTSEFNAGGRNIRAPYYAIADEIVWGATSMIMAEFVEIIRRVKIKNSGLFRPESIL
jgi:8-oxo-dGTP pyrophosphatase MutT (NUDIX family)